jgi:DNA repair exonuclease SbcCD ATPase subunit
VVRSSHEVITRGVIVVFVDGMCQMSDDMVSGAEQTDTWEVRYYTASDEIKQLRQEISEQQTSLDESLSECSTLRERARSLNEQVVAGHGENDYLRERVGELEEASEIDFDERDRLLNRLEELESKIAEFIHSENEGPKGHGIDTVYQENRALEAEIKGLQKDNEKLIGRVERIRGYNEGLKARVEELEGKISNEKRIIFDESCEWFKDKHIFTNEEIDAAWIMATTGGYQSAEEDLAIAALSELHIFRCKGGPSAAECINGKMADPHHGRMDPCPYCKGRGLVIGGEDE